MAAQGISEDTGLIVVYDLDFKLNVISVALTDPAQARYRELEADLERLKRELESCGASD
jgi:hypothetical protein